jgi:glycosyltransferase involved in cell wall biosynthesis
MKISILSSAHKFNDDRLYHHFAKTLAQQGNLVNIVSSDNDIETKGEISISSFNGMKFNRKEKIKIYIKKLSKFNPDIIICLEPIPVFAAKKYTKKKNIKIVYDITEWYPSKNQIQKHLFGIKWFYALVYFVVFLYSCYLSDGFIISEYYKGIIPKKLFPKKKSIQISYYPKEEYITKTKPNLNNNLLRLSYSGTLSKEKGFVNFLNVLKELIHNDDNLKIRIKIIGEFNQNEKNECLRLVNEFDKNISFSFFDFQELTKFIELVNDTDVFLDLRSTDLINSHCLPIKLFYYIALQRPIIYSDLIAIRKEIEVENFGYLVNPKDSKKIADLINNYQSNQTLYLSHCSKARNLFELKYNWQIQEEKFIGFVEGFKS